VLKTIENVVKESGPWIGRGSVVKYDPKNYLPKYGPKADYQNLPYWIQ
jgi:hypothetical protein